MMFGEVSQLNSSIDGASCREHKTLDLAFYDSSTIAVLLKQETGSGSPVLALVPFTAFPDSSYRDLPSNDL